MKELKGRHVGIILGIAFGVVLIANGIFIYVALSGGEGVPHAYERAAQYNKAIAATKTRGWTHSVSVRGNNNISFKIKDRDGKPITGLVVRGAVGQGRIRGTASQMDLSQFAQTFALTETGPGLYSVQVKHLRITVDSPEVQHVIA